MSIKHPFLELSIPLVLVASFLSSCSSSSGTILRLDPLPSKNASYAKAVSQSQGKPIAEVRAYPVGARRGTLEISVAIQNQSDSVIVVDPSRFVASRFRRDSTNRLQRSALVIQDPRTLVAELESQKSQIMGLANPYEQNATGAAVDAAVSMLDAALILGGKDTPALREARRDREEQDQTRKLDMSNFESNRRLALDRIEQLKTRVKEDVWQTTELAPGRSASKSIILDSPNPGDTLQLSLPIRNEPHDFFFAVSRSSAQ